MSITRACPKRRIRVALLLAAVLAWPLCVAAQGQTTTGVQRLQRQQQRDGSLRQQSISEQQRQRSSTTGRSATHNPQLSRQLDHAETAQHRQYRQRRQQTITAYPDLPSPADLPVQPPQDQSADQAKAPASARSSG